MHEEVHTSWPHGSQPVRVAPGAHVPPPTQVLQPDQVPQLHVDELHVRVRDWLPVLQLPQLRVSRSVSPGVHSPAPPPTHVQAPQVQSDWQVRSSVPQPQAAPVWRVPGAQAPSPVHAPSFIHIPSTQVCRWVPHIPQSSSRGAEPTVQSHVVGALQVPQTPSVQASIPSPQELEQARSAVAPTVSSASSQSVVTGTPSPSASTSSVTQTPSRHT